MSARPILDPENTHTESIEVILTDVVMSGAEVGPDPEPVRPVSHRRRDSILGVVACVTGAASFIVLVYAVLFVWGDR